MYFEYKGINLYYEKYGDGKETLVILPGWGDTSETFSRFIQILQDYYTIYIIDWPGFGNSTFPSYNMTIYDYTDLIHEWMMSLNIEKPILIGHSFGGRVIITLTGYYGYLYDRIVLMNAAGIKPKRTLKSKVRTLSYKLLKKLANILPKKIREKFLQIIFQHFSSTDYQSLPNCMRKTFQNIVTEDLTPYLKNIKSNTLLLWGNNDDATPITDAFIMSKNIKHAKLYILKDAGHFVYLDKFKEVIEILVKFIEKDIL